MADHNLDPMILDQPRASEVKPEQYVNLGGLLTNKVDPLKEGNWLAWKTRIIRILKLHKVYDYVEGKVPKPENDNELEKWEKKDLVAQTLIQINVSDDQIIHVTEAQNASEMWSNLRSIHEIRGQTSITAAKRTFYTIKIFWNISLQMNSKR
jgi:hypothetical protein